eukprot:5973654-Amphidinium_carterae.1
MLRRLKYKQQPVGCLGSNRQENRRAKPKHTNTTQASRHKLRWRATGCMQLGKVHHRGKRSSNHENTLTMMCEIWKRRCDFFV